MIGTRSRSAAGSGGIGIGGRQGARAIIDIGSNTVRLVIYGGAPRAPTVLFNEKVVAQLGLGVAQDGRLTADSVALAVRGLARFAAILRDFEIVEVDTVATAAVREAANRDALLEEVRRLGLAPRVLSGAEEAETSALGVIGAMPQAKGIVADLGGGSLELVRVGDGRVEHGISLPLGTLRLAEMRRDHGGTLRKAVGQALREWDDGAGDTLYLVGGTWRAMAIHALGQDGRGLTDPHGFSLDARQAKALTQSLLSTPPARLADDPRIAAMRAAKLPDAAVLLQALLKRLEPARLIFSSWGLREGLLYAALSPAARSQDPLLAGVTGFGAANGVAPLLATRVAGWTAGAIPTQASGSERLRLAATTLALASMRIEPNLRTQHAVEWALYKRWVTITGPERAMIAATICGNGNVADMPPELTRLASAEQLGQAFAWGLAIRLARRLGAGSVRSLEASRLEIAGDRLVLTIADSHRDLYAQPTAKDMRLLAERLGLEWAVQFESDAAEPPGSGGAAPAAGHERV